MRAFGVRGSNAQWDSCQTRVVAAGVNGAEGAGGAPRSNMHHQATRTRKAPPPSPPFEPIKSSAIPSFLQFSSCFLRQSQGYITKPRQPSSPFGCLATLLSQMLMKQTSPTCELNSTPFLRPSKPAPATRPRRVFPRRLFPAPSAWRLGRRPPPTSSS